MNLKKTEWEFVELDIDATSEDVVSTGLDKAVEKAWSMAIDCEENMEGWTKKSMRAAVKRAHNEVTSSGTSKCPTCKDSGRI